MFCFTVLYGGPYVQNTNKVKKHKQMHKSLTIRLKHKRIMYETQPNSKNTFPKHKQIQKTTYIVSKHNQITITPQYARNNNNYSKNTNKYSQSNNKLKTITNVQNTGKFEIKTATKTEKNKIRHSYMNFRTGLTPR